MGRRLPPERVLYLIWRAPWMTVSPETYVSATLAAMNAGVDMGDEDELLWVIEGSDFEFEAREGKSYNFV